MRGDLIYGISNHMTRDDTCPDCGRSLAPGEDCTCQCEQCPQCDAGDYFPGSVCQWCGYDPAKSGGNNV